MDNSPFGLRARLMVLSLLSTVIILSAGVRAAAHELLPTIADMQVTAEGTLQLDFRVNLEAFLSGIDLDAVDNTDADVAGGVYDALRARPPEEIALRAAEVVAVWSDFPLLVANGPLPLTLSDVQMPEDVGFELPRIANLSVSAPLPAGTRFITLNWPPGAGALALRQNNVDEPYTGLLSGGTSSPAIALLNAPSAVGLSGITTYVLLGASQVFPTGFEHILFMLGVFFLIPQLAALLWQVGAFTLAYTVTCVCGALGWVQLSTGVVELLIAVSIVYVAVENLLRRDLSHWRLVLVFLFGLVHGLAFASAVRASGWPDGEALLALTGFNIGVGLGQVAVLSTAALLLLLCARSARRFGLAAVEASEDRYAAVFRAVSIPCSVMIALIAASWSVARLVY